MKLGQSLGFLLILTSLAFLLAGCDSFFYPKGVVYEWKNPPVGQTGLVYVDPAQIPEGLELSPVENARISFFMALGSGCVGPSNNFVPIGGDTFTDSTGHFSNDLAIAGGNSYAMKIVVAKDGYYLLDKIFTYSFDQRTKLRFVVLLVASADYQP